MKELRSVFVIMIMAVLLVLPAAAIKVDAASYASSGSCGDKGDNVTWVLSADGVLTISGSGAMKNYEGYYDNPWDKYAVKKIYIKNGVTRIGDFAFYQCRNMTLVDIADSVSEIGTSAFYECYELKQIKVPYGVKIIQPGTFNNCQHLTRVDLPETLEIIDSYAFPYCFRLKEIQLPESLKEIRSGAFDNCGFTQLVIPENVTSIFVHAFNECSDLESVDFAVGGKECNIGDAIFRNCKKLKSVNFSDRVSRIGYAMFWGCDELIQVSGTKHVTSIGDSAFRECGKLKDFDFPESLTSIGSMAFAGDSLLESVEIPGSVKTIEGQTFQSCNAMKKLILHSGTEQIRWGAFNACSALEEVRLPNSIKTLAGVAFSSCSNLKNVYFEGAAPAIEKDTFEGDTFTAWYPAGNKTWTEEVRQQYGGKITWKTWDSGVGDLTSGSCGGSVTWKLVTDAGLQAEMLKDPYNELSDGKIKNTLVIEGTGPMEDYTSDAVVPWRGLDISFVKIGEGVSRIGNYAFAGSKIQSITLPDTMAEIGAYSFAGCRQLKCVRIPVSAKKIENSSFVNCSNLQDIYYAGSVNQWNTINGAKIVFGPGYNIWNLPQTMRLHYYVKTGGFDYIDDVWSFSNLTSYISVSYYQRFYGNTLAKELQRSDDGLEGACAGMAITEMAAWQKLIDFTSNQSGSKALRDIRSDTRIKEFTLTVEELIKLAHIYKYSLIYAKNAETLQSWFKDQYDNIDNFSKAVDQFDGGKGAANPVFVQVGAKQKNGSRSGHCMVAVKAVETTPQYRKILVCDSNSPLALSYLYLYGSNGHYTSWKYEGNGTVYESSAEEAHLAFDTDYAENFVKDLKTGKKYYDGDGVIIGLARNAAKKIINAMGTMTESDLLEGRASGMKSLSGGLSCGNFDFYQIDEPVTIELEDGSAVSSLVIGDAAYHITAPKGSKVTLGSGTAPVIIHDTAGEPVTVDCEISTDGTHSLVTKIIGNGSGEIIFSRNKDGILFSGLEKSSVEISENLENPNGTTANTIKDVQELANADGSSKYLIAVDPAGSQRNVVIHKGDKKTDPLVETRDSPKTAGDSDSTPSDLGKTSNPAGDKVGTEFTKSGNRYQITKISGKKGEVKLTRGAAGKKNVTIPATITRNGITYKVTAIAHNSFYGNKKIKKAVIGKNVKRIGKRAFRYCSNLKTIEIKSKVLTKAEKKCFKGIHKKAVIKVPSSCLKKYKKLFKGKGQAKTVKIKK